MATIRESLLQTRLLLGHAGDDDPDVSAEWLLEWVTGKSRTQLYVDADEELGLSERLRLMSATARRSAGEPLQYITGSAPFRTIEVACEPGVLIPRPETELLVELALEALKTWGSVPGSGSETTSRRNPADEGTETCRRKPGSAVHASATDDSNAPDGMYGGARFATADGRPVQADPADGQLRVLELGTGTGCIALSVATERPDARVIATDIAPEAVALARKNAEALGLSERIEVLEGDLADPVPEDLLGTFDLLISNPPYVPTSVVDNLGPEVRDHEPRLALDGGADGLDVFRHILDLAPRALRPGGILAVELFEESLDEARDLAESQGIWETVEILKDLAGRPRHLIARLSNVLPCDPRHPSPEVIDRALAVLEREGVLILPTDSVYGIGCLATADADGAPNPALARVFELKRRDPSQTLPLLVADPSDLHRWGSDVPVWARDLAESRWPGALTLVVKASPELPAAFRAADGTVGLRVPDCPLVRELVRRSGHPMAVSSANLHDEPAARSSAELAPALAAGADLVLDGGPAPIGVASTVVDATGPEPRVLRQGALVI